MLVSRLLGSLYIRPHQGVRRRFSNSVQSGPQMSTTFKFAGIQLAVTSDKEKNLENAKSLIDEAVKNGAQVVALPVCITSSILSFTVLYSLMFAGVLQLSLWQSVLPYLRWDDSSGPYFPNASRHCEATQDLSCWRWVLPRWRLRLLYFTLVCTEVFCARNYLLTILKVLSLSVLEIRFTTLLSPLDLTESSLVNIERYVRLQRKKANFWLDPPVWYWYSW